MNKQNASSATRSAYSSFYVIDIFIQKLIEYQEKNCANTVLRIASYYVCSTYR